MKISKLFILLTVCMSAMSGCANRPEVLAFESTPNPPEWSQISSGSKMEGIEGEGFYGVGRISEPIATAPGQQAQLVQADNQAMEMLSLVLDRFWARSLSLLTQKTGAYGLFRAFEGAPCRISFADGNQQIVARWSNMEKGESYSLAFLSKRDIQRQLGGCKGCLAHPVCKMMSANLEEILMDFTAWNEVAWTSDQDVANWIKRGPGPFVDGPAGRGFYGVGLLEEPQDLAISTLDLQHRAAVSLHEAMLTFIKQTTGYEVGLSNGTDSIVPPCITAVQHLGGEVIEMHRLPDGRPDAALAFLPAARVRSAVKDCNGCAELNICRAMYDRFDALFKSSAKKHQQNKK